MHICLSLTTSYIGMLNFYVLSILQVNSVGVWTTFRRGDRNVIDMNARRAVKFEMALRAINDLNVANCDIRAGIESQCLQ